MCVCEMDDLPGHSVAFTSTCTTELDCFGKIRTRGKVHVSFKTNVYKWCLQLPQEMSVFINKIGA